MPMNMLNSIRTAYEAGDTAKQDYIEAIHARHASLFDYPEFIAGTDVESLRILPEGIFVRSRSQQIELFLDPQDQHLVPCTLMNFRAYETIETEFLKAITQENGVILDIGANCGWYALALARHCPSHRFTPSNRSPIPMGSWSATSATTACPTYRRTGWPFPIRRQLWSFSIRQTALEPLPKCWQGSRAARKACRGCPACHHT